MAAVAVDIQRRPSAEASDQAEFEVEVVEELDVLVESSTCSCNAGDDNSY